MSTENIPECSIRGCYHSPGTQGVEGESPTLQGVLQCSQVGPPLTGVETGTSLSPSGGLLASPVYRDTHKSQMPESSLRISQPDAIVGKGVEGKNPLLLQSGPAEADPQAIILNTIPNLAYLPAPRIIPKHCTPRYSIIGCGCKRQIRPDTCHSLDCVTCAPWASRRRSQSVFDRLKGLSEYKHRTNAVKTVIYSVFTVPISHRERFYDKSEWQKVRLKVWKVLKKHFGALFGVEASHPVGDTESEVFHPHLNFLWQQRPGWSPFISVDLLRTEWARILNVDVADVHTQYAGNEAMIRHWCNYVMRVFPGAMEWAKPIRWYGSYPVRKTPPINICPECGQPYKILGYILKEDYDDWNERGWMSGMDPPWERDECIIPFVKRR